MDSDEIANLVRNLKLSSDAQGGAVKLTQEEVIRGNKRLERVVVSKIFARRAVNKEVLKSQLPRILRSRGRMEVEMIGYNLFVISFSLEADKRMAIEEGPWHFFSDLMVFKQTEYMQTPTEVTFEEITLWVQCHNVPLACMEESIITRIGEKVGKVEEVDVGEGGLCMGKFARVRVTRRIDSPLVRCVPMVDEQENKKVLIILQYEKLPEFCFVCGCVGHISKDCGDKAEGKGSFKFDSWLRAGHVWNGSREPRYGNRATALSQQRKANWGVAVEEIGSEETRTLAVMETEEKEGEDDTSLKKGDSSDDELKGTEAGQGREREIVGRVEGEGSDGEERGELMEEEVEVRSRASLSMSPKKRRRTQKLKDGNVSRGKSEGIRKEKERRMERRGGLGGDEREMRQR